MTPDPPASQPLTKREAKRQAYRAAAIMCQEAARGTEIFDNTGRTDADLDLLVTALFEVADHLFKKAGVNQ